MSNFQTKYKVLQKIGEGSFSEVLKCENRETGICYAAKRLKKTFKSNEGVLNCAEIIASQKIPYHQNVLNLLEFHYDVFTGKTVFIFELMDMSMYDFLKGRSRRFSEMRVKGFLYQILKGLNHLHSHGLFHRDVKPENILIKLSNSISCREIIKLADLGSVRGIYSDPPYTEYISTRWYRSPECLLTVGNYGPKMDIWAAGCVFYEMLTLKPLFPGNNELDQLHKIHAILGAPNGRLLEKLKNKSRNCTCFPETNGSGLYKLIGHVSEQGRRIFKLMLDYDPDKRINAKRLLQCSYFDQLRWTDGRPEKTIQQYKPGLKSSTENWSHTKRNESINRDKPVVGNQNKMGHSDSKIQKSTSKGSKTSSSKELFKSTIDTLTILNKVKNSAPKIVKGESNGNKSVSSKENPKSINVSSFWGRVKNADPKTIKPPEHKTVSSKEASKSTVDTNSFLKKVKSSDAKIKKATSEGLKQFSAKIVSKSALDAVTVKVVKQSKTQRVNTTPVKPSLDSKSLNTWKVKPASFATIKPEIKSLSKM